MDENLTEEQQLEQIRNWWKENGTSVILGAVIGLSALGGWKFYQTHQIDTGRAASDAFEQVVKLSEQEGKSAELVKSAETLVKDHSGTVYAQFGQLYLAREAVKNNELDKAAEWLKAVAAKPEHEAIGHTATIRLARILLAQNKAEEALALAQVSKEKAGTYNGAYAMVRGDALLALGRLADANAAFNEAKTEGDPVANHPELSMKLDVTTP